MLKADNPMDMSDYLSRITYIASSYCQRFTHKTVKPGQIPNSLSSTFLLTEKKLKNSHVRIYIKNIFLHSLTEKSGNVTGSAKGKPLGNFQNETLRSSSFDFPHPIKITKMHRYYYKSTEKN